METENASLTRKLIETREKYNKCRAHLEEIKTRLTNQNIKNVVQENIDLCNIRVKIKLFFVCHNQFIFILILFFRMDYKRKFVIYNVRIVI